MACYVARAYLSSSLSQYFNRCVVCRWHQFSRMSTETVTSASLLETGNPSPLPSDDKVLPVKIQQLVKEITSLTLLEVAELNSALKKKLNIPDIPVFPPSGFPAALGQASSAASTANLESAEEESDKPAAKSLFSLKLSKFDEAKKITLIKEIRNVISGLNLVQAKKFVDSIPAVVKEDLSKQEAEELKEKLEKAGASCEII